MKKIGSVLRKIWNWISTSLSEAEEIQKRIDEERDRYHRNYWRIR